MFKTSIKYGRTHLHAGRLTISAKHWPWQKRGNAALLSSAAERKMDRYGWRGTDGMGRFGGGWNWNLGIQIGGKTILLSLLFGTITISWWRKP